MNMRKVAKLFRYGKLSGGFMNKLCVFVAVLALAAMSLPGHSHETDEPEKVRPAVPEVLPDIIMFDSAIGDVAFPHTKHQKMRCSKCHHQIHAAELETPHEDYLEVSWIKCQACHYEGSVDDSSYYKCSGCHHAEPENAVDETISSKVVIHQNCWKCHKSGTGVKASKGCSYCHEEQE